MFANNQNEVMNYNVILNKKNYNDRLSRLKVSLTSMNLKEFIDNDVIEQLKKKNPNDKARIKKTMMKDSKVQMKNRIKIGYKTNNPMDTDSINRMYKGINNQK
ncbi:hypothetical protein LY90DRAFT_507375 [Neocallimastix californiae]|uniref:Uncharacterized protein n=1 Tax=Neocallimastix californiae TaxID=1754190 RepID=A0A1Y2D636_9FUNG|nr:hypothetical protein LY90DRAFT_507375 [Neocallimastix californiae]|eukprot:ORY54769.1 hypothetical protein LY90DRAFT_507375 [Neocallimastix californiae]